MRGSRGPPTHYLPVPLSWQGNHPGHGGRECWLVGRDQTWGEAWGSETLSARGAVYRWGALKPQDGWGARPWTLGHQAW